VQTIRNPSMQDFTVPHRALCRRRLFQRPTGEKAGNQDREAQTMLATPGQAKDSNSLLSRNPPNSTRLNHERQANSPAARLYETPRKCPFEKCIFCMA
jgi:hypothetical protein